MKNRKKIIVLGSTGSIGTQALDMIKESPNDFQVVALSCNNNIKLFQEQLRAFRPTMAALGSEKAALEFKELFPNIKFFYGGKGLALMSGEADADILLNAVVGIAGLVPTYEALKSGKKVALANKETLVSGGSIITKLALDMGKPLIPVDSEHSAIFQCLRGNEKEKIKKVILTASGGPFRGKSLEELKNVTLDDALNHPTWNMGKKITIDSATMMNKGFEVIEAHWLFNLSGEKISILVHPESIIHSMVEYDDGAVMAQLGVPDMKLPIAYALNYPSRKKTSVRTLNLADIGKLSFENVDRSVFKCLDLAYYALDIGGACGAILNAANEVLVAAFLEGKIPFLRIQEILEEILDSHMNIPSDTIEDIINADKIARNKALQLIFSKI